MANSIFSKNYIFIFPLCLLFVACNKRDVGIKSSNGLYVIHVPTPNKGPSPCSKEQMALIDTSNFRKMPLFDQLIVVDRGSGSGANIDYSDTTFMCDSWNMNGGSNIYRTFFGLPDISDLPNCVKIKKANLWIHSDQKPDYYAENPTDSIQLLLTLWPKDSIDKIKWLRYPASYTNTLSVSNKPYQHNAWMCFDMTNVVQSIVWKHYNNNLFIMRTSGENMFIDSTRQKNLIGPKNRRQNLRPYFEIIF